MSDKACKHGIEPGQFCGDCFRESQNPTTRRAAPMEDPGFTSDDRAEFERLKKQGTVVDKILLLGAAFVIFWIIIWIIGGIADARVGR